MLSQVKRKFKKTFEELRKPEIKDDFQEDRIEFNQSTKIIRKI